MTTTSASPPGRSGRWRVTAYAAEQVLWLLPLLLATTLTVVGGVLTVAVIGVPILLLGLPLLRQGAHRQRQIAARVLGLEVPESYRPADLRRPWHWLRTAAADPLSWRDLIWALWAVTFGWLLSLTVVLLLVSVVTGVVWWYGAHQLMRLRSLVDVALLAPAATERLDERVGVLTRTRAQVADASAAELRRLERDLHDGTQARLVAVAMSLGLADTQLDHDPETARRTVREAREATRAALVELRAVVRGIHPPVLADRGVLGAVQALALDMSVPVEVTGALAGRPPAPVESAAYFAVAECLANAAKHSGCQHGWVTVEHRDAQLVVEVGDDGHGGAKVDAGTGIRGVMRRLALCDGTMVVSSPSGGPTVVTVEIPCELSSPKTTPSSGPA